MAAVYTKTCAR